VFSLLGEVNEVQSSIPSHMKYISTLDIMTNGSLKFKRCTLVIINCEATSNFKTKNQRGWVNYFSPSYNSSEDLLFQVNTSSFNEKETFDGFMRREKASKSCP